MTTVTTQRTTLEYVQAPETAENLDWADLATLDLSKFDRPGGKQELARELTKAISEVGKSLWPIPVHQQHPV